MNEIIQYCPAKDIIIKSKLPDTDYVVNAYLGCVFGCAYCYASFMGRRVPDGVENWGNFVYVKKNSVSLFSEELAVLIRKNAKGSILFSSVTDPYQPLEAKLLLTRQMLQVCCAKEYQGKISILTKSPLVTRDIDILSHLESREVGVTITHIVDEPGSLIKRLERKAPTARARLATLEKLNNHGIKTYAFVGPLLPHLFQAPDQIENIFQQINQIGTREVFVEYLNIKPSLRNKILLSLERGSDLYNFYKNFNDQGEQNNDRDEMINKFLKKHNLTLRLKKVFRHK